MKIQFTFLCFGLSTALVAASTTGELVQDKPDRLYVSGDMLVTDSYSDNVTSDSAGGVTAGQIWHHDDYQWQAGVGGSGSIQDVRESDDWDSEGYLWGSTNITSAQMTWGADGNGTEIYTANDGTSVPYQISLPLLTSEHCLVNDPQSFPLNIQSIGGDSWVTNQVQEAYLRNSQTRWRLQTGGRASGQSLFRLSGMATNILDKRAQRPFYNVNSRPISPQNISVMGRALYADGSLWCVLPAGADLEVTPFVASQDFYTTALIEQKYAPSITANSVSLGAGTPEFCVGQYLQFRLAFDPPVESVSQMSLWYLPGEPINEGWQQSSNGSINYRLNRNLLTNLTTHCWYSSGLGGKALLGTSLEFRNGQFCCFTVPGNFSLARPGFSGFDNFAPLVGFVWSSPVLVANMRWGVTVQSDYDGNVGVTQLINGTNSCCNTGGAFCLDGSSEIFNTMTNTLGQAYSAADPATHLVSLQDARSAIASPAVTLAAAFKDYLRFRPAGNASNIWVTLATNSWSMDGSASLSGGLIRSNLQPANVLVDSTEFPSWTQSYGP
jgi:hypothetical protein